MSNTVDNRAVHLGFENQQFESGVKTSIDSLDKLKKSLDLTEQAKSLQNFSNAGKGFNLSGIADGVQNLSNRFSAFGIIGMTVLQNLTNKAMEFGNKLWQSLVTPAKQGFNEYEIQMNAIQTIMANTASKGTTLKDVNATLDELNTYADKTIYNFAEMAKNIGTFTAAGVDLKTSAAAIKGIGNLAAVSGSNSQQAATAMYQLSQALASGTVKLMDWNSVVNAGMGGEVFKNALMETARVHGIAIDDIIKKEGSFRESLTTGWLSSSILTETLSKFTGDLTAEQLKSIGYTEQQIVEIQKLGVMANDAATKVKTFTQLKQTLQEGLSSGWAKSWQIMFGDFEAAKTFFTYLSDTFGGLIQQSSDARNATLQGWKDWGGRMYAIEAIKNTIGSMLSVMKMVGVAWSTIFPTRSEGYTLAKITRVIRDFTDNLRPGAMTALKLTTIFKGLFAILDIGKMAIEALIDSFGKLDTSGIKPLLTGLLDFLTIQAQSILATRDLIKTNDTFGKALEKVKVYFQNIGKSVSDFGNKVKTVFDKIKVLIEEVKNTFKGFFDNFQNALNFNKIDTSGATSFVDKLRLRFAPLDMLFKGTVFIIDGLINFLKKSAPILLQLGSWMGKVLGQLGTAIMNAVSTIDFSNLFDTLNAGFLGAFILAITKFVKSGSGAMDSLGGMFKGVSGILDGVRTSLQAWQENLKSKTLLNIAIAVGILAASLLVLSLIDSKKLSSSMLAITTIFIELVGAMKGLSMTGGGGGAGVAATLIAMSVSLLLIVAAVSVLAKLNPDEIGNGLVALGLISTGIAIFMRTVGGNAKSFAGAAVSLIILAVGLEIIVNVVKRLGSIDLGILQKGLSSLGVVLLELAVFTQLIGKNMGVGSAIGIIGLAAAIMLISISVEKLGKMDVGVLKQGLITIGAILLEVGLFTRLVGNGLNLMATAVGMTVLGAAMLIFAEAVTKLGKLTWEEIQRGMAGMAGALLAIVVAVKLMPKSMIVTAVGLLIVGGAITILADALKKMSTMKWDEIGRGLAVLAGSLLIIAVAMYAMTGAIGGALALLVVSAALAVLTPVLKTLGSMGIGEIAIALGALAAAFIILGVAGMLITPSIPGLLGLGVAIALIGAAVALIGGGLLMFSAGLAALAVGGVAGATAFVAIVGILLGIIPMLIEALVNGIILFANLIIEAAPVIGEAIIVLIATLCGVIIASVPPLVQALTVLLDGLWTLVKGQVPKAVDTVLFVIGEMLRSLAAKIPEFTQSAFDILIGFLQGIRDNIGEVVTVVGEIVVEFLNAVAAQLKDIIQAGVNLMISFIEGITAAVKSTENKKRMLDAIKELADAIIKGLTDGLLGSISQITAAIGRIGSSIIKALKTLLGIASASKVTTEMGMYLSEGLAKGMLKRINQVEDAAQEVAKRTLDSMNKAVAGVNDGIRSEIDMNPVIRPVIDLTDVINSGKNIEKYLNRNGLQLPAGMDNVARVAVGMNNQNGSNGVVNPVGNNINFYQTNTSPKALSSFEIYRDTRNQLLMLKGLVISQ